MTDEKKQSLQLPQMLQHQTNGAILNREKKSLVSQRLEDNHICFKLINKNTRADEGGDDENANAGIFGARNFSHKAIWLFEPSPSKHCMVYIKSVFFNSFLAVRQTGSKMNPSQL